jgi:hypothetical protein
VARSRRAVAEHITAAASATGWGSAPVRRRGSPGATNGRREYHEVPAGYTAGLGGAVGCARKKEHLSGQMSTHRRKCVLYWECESPGVGAAADAGGG